MSTNGVQQGGPLRLLLFDLVLHSLIPHIRYNYKLLFHSWYLNDGTRIWDSEEVAKAFDIIRETDPKIGLKLHILKTGIFLPSMVVNFVGIFSFK